MRFKLVAIALAGVLLAACETTTDETASTSAGGAMSDRSAGASSSASTSGSETRGSDTRMSSRDAGSGERSGSAEDFVVNVGDRIFFGVDHYDLSPEARDVLERQSAWLARYPMVTIIVAGHADERGTREYNLALGERRATAVKNYLAALGIDPNRVRTISYGKERPVDPRSSDDAWSKNRRGVTMIDEPAVSLSN